MIFALFWEFFKIGLFTFGGGYAMISQLRDIVCEKKKWINDEELMQIISVAESTPGPIAINMATYVGYKKGKLLGSIMATLGVVLPSVIIIFIISLFLNEFMSIKYVKYAFYGINSAVAFLIIRTAFSLFKKLEKKALPLITFSIVFILMIIFEIFTITFSSIYFILFGGIIGILVYALLLPKPEED